MFNFQAGDFVPVAWQPTGGALTTLNIKSHSLDLEAMLFDTTNTGSGGVRSRLAGPLDISGTVNADFDADQPPYATPPLILPGVSGICVFGMTPNRGIQTPVIIAKKHYESGVESEVKYSFDVKANSRAGLLVYPPIGN